MPRAWQGRRAGDALSALVAGYEVGARAAIALHGTVSDYHSSGAWNALAVVATGARLKRVTGDELREALGIAEYHGPRGQMMRVIDSPTMVHDGSASGRSPAPRPSNLAEMGFTGAPAITVEAEEVDPVWRDLGETWAVARHYIKPYPVCRWTHALIDGALLLKRTNAIRAEDIAAIELTSFHEATRLTARSRRRRRSREYAVSFPVASALVKGRLGVEEIAGAGLKDTGGGPPGGGDNGPGGGSL